MPNLRAKGTLRMYSVFALICLANDPSICREVMIAQPDISAGICVTSNQVAADWVASRPHYTSTSVTCRETNNGLDFQEVAPGVFAHLGHIALPDGQNLVDISNFGFVVGRDSVVVFDSGGSRAVGEAALRGVRRITELPISHVVLGHMHPDHVFGASVFAEAGAKVIGHDGLEAALAARADNYLESLTRLVGKAGFLGSEVPVIDEGVSGKIEIDIGDRVVELTSFATAHTSADLTMIDQQTRTLFSSDLVFLQHTPALDGSVRGWQAAMDRLAGFDAARVVPGHGPVSEFPQALGPTESYLDRLATETKEQIDKGVSLSQAAPIIAQSERENWQLFDEFNIRNATGAYAEIEWE